MIAELYKGLGLQDVVSGGTRAESMLSEALTSLLKLREWQDLWKTPLSLICDERRDPVLVRLPQVIAAESVGCFLETGTQYVTDCEGDVPLDACQPNLSGASLEEGIIAPAGLKDVDSGLVVTDEVNELVHELRSPQLDGQCGVESLEIADEWVVLQYPGGNVA